MCVGAVKDGLQFVSTGKFVMWKANANLNQLAFILFKPACFRFIFSLNEMKVNLLSVARCFMQTLWLYPKILLRKCQRRRSAKLPPNRIAGPLDVITQYRVPSAAKAPAHDYAEWTARLHWAAVG